MHDVIFKMFTKLTGQSIVSVMTIAMEQIIGRRKKQNAVGGVLEAR